jgi:hypothetical protein
MYSRFSQPRRWKGEPEYRVSEKHQLSEEIQRKQSRYRKQPSRHSTTFQKVGRTHHFLFKPHYFSFKWWWYWLHITKTFQESIHFSAGAIQSSSITHIQHIPSAILIENYNIPSRLYPFAEYRHHASQELSHGVWDWTFGCGFSFACSKCKS